MPIPVFPTAAIPPKMRCKWRHLRRPARGPLALAITGDVAGFTCYVTRRGRQVFYPASPALQHPTPAQQLQRACWHCAMADWAQLQPADRDLYRLACARLHLMLHGVNLWLTLSLNPDDGTYDTLCRQASLALIRPVYYGHVSGVIARYAWDRVRAYMTNRAATDCRWGFVPPPMP